MKQERKIYLVMGGLDYEPAYVLGIYTTEEAATTKMKRLMVGYEDSHYFYVTDEVLKGELE